MMWESSNNTSTGTPTTKSTEDCCIDVIECARYVRDRSGSDPQIWRWGGIANNYCNVCVRFGFQILRSQWPNWQFRISFPCGRTDCGVPSHNTTIIAILIWVSSRGELLIYTHALLMRRIIRWGNPVEYMQCVQFVEYNILGRETPLELSSVRVVEYFVDWMDGWAWLGCPSLVSRVSLSPLHSSTLTSFGLLFFTATK